MILVVSHDAGGAEVLSSYCRQHPGAYSYSLDGPGQKVFARKLGGIENLPLSEGLARSDSVLCGTSWQSDLELRAIQAARAAGKPSVAFLDHWINYRARFVRNGDVVLPDEVWVGDAIAVERATRELPEVPVRLVENPYFAELKREFPAAAPGRGMSAGKRLLYVGEPIRDNALAMTGNARARGYVEEEALDYLLAHLDALGPAVEEIRIRPHPSETAEKYRWVASRTRARVVIEAGQTLVRDIADADVVAGCQSMAMVVGLLAGKRVVSCIPPGGAPCELPQENIEHLQDLVAQANRKP